MHRVFCCKKWPKEWSPRRNGRFFIYSMILYPTLLQLQDRVIHNCHVYARDPTWKNVQENMHNVLQAVESWYKTKGHCIKTRLYLSKPVNLSLNLLWGNQGMNLLIDRNNGYKSRMTYSNKFFFKVEFWSLTAAGNWFVCLHWVLFKIPHCSYEVTFLQSESTMTCLKNENSKICNMWR